MEAHSEAARLELKRAMLVCALAIVGFFVEDWVILGHFARGAFAVRFAWGGVLALVGLRIPRASHRERDLLLCIASAASVACFSWVVWLTGVHSGANLLWMACLPLGIALVSQGNLPSSLLACALTLVALPCLLWLDGAEARAVIASIGEALAACVIGVYAVFSLARLRKAEAAEHQARLEALERLALSEKQRNRAERLALIGRLATGVAHEINNPLSFVRSNLEFLERTLGRGERLNPGDFERLMAETLRGLDRIRQIVTDLNGFARDDASELEACALEEVIAESIRLASVRLNRVARIERRIDPGLPQVRVHRRWLSQVLVNLLVNAADALEGSEHDPRCITLVGAHAAGFVILAVEDTGPGIPEALLSEIFEPFVTTKPPGKGTGLGLALSREYVERFGGQLVAENRPEGGARFVLRLPLAAAAARAA